MNIRDGWEKHKFVHFVWVICILICIVILLASSNLGTNSNVKDIINFAVSLTSLFLAAFAIVQALLSGGALPEAVADVRRAISEVKDPANKLAQAADVIDLHSRTIGERATDITRAISTIPTSQANTATTVDENKGAEIDVSSKILDDASLMMKLGLYVALLSFEGKKHYVSRDIAADPADALNIVGVITGLVGINAIRAKKVGNGKFYIEDLGQMSWLISNKAELVTNFPRQKDFANETISHINGYFEKAPTIG